MMVTVMVQDELVELRTRHTQLLDNLGKQNSGTPSDHEPMVLQL